MDDRKDDTTAAGQAASSGNAIENERRAEPRRRTFKGAKVLLNDRSSVIDCVVRDISNTGARLVFKDFQPLPQRFELSINDLGTYECEIVRANQMEFGVRFVSKK